MEIAKYNFPVRMYWWADRREVYGVISGIGSNDLETPEYTSLFMTDIKTQLDKARLKDGGKLIEEHAWSVEGHPGWRLMEEVRGRRHEIRVFVFKHRFYLFRVEFDAPQQHLSDAQRRVLESFKLLSDVEVAEEKERLVNWAGPPALPQQPPANPPISDTQTENLKGNVKQIVEETRYGEPIPLGLPNPKIRSEFNEQGYLVSKVEYDFESFPTKIFRYGYLNRTRVYKRADRRGLPEFADQNISRSVIKLFQVRHRYAKDGTLEEVRFTEDEGESTEVYSYRRKESVLQITLKQRWIRGGPELLISQSTIESNVNGDPVREEKSEYYPFTRNDFVTLDKPVDSYSVVSSAIGGTTLPTDGTLNKSPTTNDVTKNPNVSVRTRESIPVEGQKKSTERSYSYSYEYDSHGNWIKRTTFDVERSGNNTVKTPISVTFRKISYY